MHQFVQGFSLGWWRRDKQAAIAKPPKYPTSGDERHGATQRKITRRGLRGHNSSNVGVVDDAKMSNNLEASSEGTKSDDEAIATGMTNLAIACKQVLRQSKLQTYAAGKWASQSRVIWLGLGFRSPTGLWEPLHLKLFMF